MAIQRPTIGLLNIGVEEVKGQDEIREAGRLLRESTIEDLSYHGFVEGNDLGRGTVDVVVTEGFTGNVALKTAEGTVKQVASYLRDSLSRTFLSRLGYFLARGAFARLREKLDPRKVNGGVFLGLNGIVIKSHGGSDAEGTAAAMDIAHAMATADLVRKIARDLEIFNLGLTASAAPSDQAAERAQ